MVSPLAIVRGLMNWYATRPDNYVSPITKGMARPVPGGDGRERVLSDDDRLLIWPTLTRRAFLSIKALARITRDAGRGAYFPL